MIGTKLAHYEITSHLGSGGMGDVYQATDSKLGRSVAIKFLPEAFSNDTERVARFQREARVLASLNHSNIAAIHGLEEIDSRLFLVMELVGGETLAERIKRGPIPVDESLAVAKQICEALEAAHEKGVIHRDLKPANVKITPEGKVKVLDFGLAKAFETETSKANLSQSPTLSMAATNAGVILGTAAYMSPEQAKGRVVDRRTDIFAFGCVLYEMLTGRPAFEGEDVQDILGAVLRSEPDWTRLPADIPPGIRKLLRRCLEKNVKNRRSDAADVRIDIEEALAEPATAIPATPTARSSRLAWIARAFATIIIVTLAIPAARHLREAAPPEMRVDIVTPPTSDPVSFALSPDGKQIVYVASGDGASRLWLRSLSATTPQPLAGTEGALYPFWSPDSASVGFFAEGKLKRIDIAGGRPEVLANASNGLGGAWGSEAVILFVPSDSLGSIFKIPAAGGEPTAVVRKESGQTPRFPQFLPDGRHFIYYVGGSNRGIYAGALDGSPSKRLTSADAAAVVSPSGFLFFPQQTTLFAQAFDFRKVELSGSPLPVAEELALTAASAAGVTAGSDAVAFRTRSSSGTYQLTWLDRSGNTVNNLGPPSPDRGTTVELSQDGKRVAVDRPIDRNTDVWLADTARGTLTRFTFDARSDRQPVWSPDGSRIVFQSNRTGITNIYQKLSSGAGTEELLLESNQVQTPESWSLDGRFLLFRNTDLQTGHDLWILPMSGDRKPFPFVKTPSEELNGQFSPDGKWIAYQSNESGRYEIFAQPFPGPGGKFQVSVGGGTQARWNKNGKEIFYVSLDSKLMDAPVKLSPDGQAMETGSPEVLFPLRIAGGPISGIDREQYAVSADGQRFLVNLVEDEGATPPITLIMNWRPPAK